MMNNNVKEFFENKKINMVAIDRDNSNWVEYLTKVKLNERFDYIFKTDNYGSINLTDSKMKILGLLDNVSKRFYINDTWYMDRHLPEIKYISLYDVTRLMREDVKKAYNKYIYDNIGDFKSMGYKAYKEYMSYSENVAYLNSKAQERYISNFKLDKIEFSFYNKYYGNSDDGIADTQTILQYIVEGSAFISNVVLQELDKNNDIISSSTSGIPNIPVSRAEKIGFDLLELDYINERIDELAKDTKSLLSKKKFIKEAIDTDTMKTVNVTVVNNNETLTFKYSADQLSRLYMSEYYIPDLATRSKYKNLFKDKWYHDDDIIAKIVKIEYGKKVIYEGEDLSTD